LTGIISGCSTITIFPFSIGHHVGSGKSDANEFIIVRLDKTLAISEHVKDHDDEWWDDDGDDRGRVKRDIPRVRWPLLPVA
jgi:hypothetical protein